MNWIGILFLAVMASNLYVLVSNKRRKEFIRWYRQIIVYRLTDQVAFEKTTGRCFRCGHTLQNSLSQCICYSKRWKFRI